MRKLFVRQVSNLLSFLFLFIYLFPIYLKGLPFSTRIILSLIGIILVFYSILKYKKITIDKHLCTIFFTVVLLSSVSIISLLINNTSDVEFVTYPITFLLICFSSHAVIEALRFLHGGDLFENILRMFIITCVVQAVLALMFFFIPEVKDFFYQFIKSNELEELALERSLEYRLQGLGANFFIAGIMNAIALIFVSYLLFYEKNKSKLKLYLIFFFLILVIGSAMSRTSAVGAGIGLIFLFWKSCILNLKVRTEFLKLTKYLFIIISLIILVCIYFYNTSEQFALLMRYGFDAFFNYFEEGELRTNSTDALMEVYIFPEALKSFIIGDGLFADPLNPETSYYMHTDVGYSRLLFYFGIIGSFTYFFMHYYVSKKCWQLDKKNQYLYIMLLILFFILLNKGVVNLMHVFMLFWFSLPYRKDIQYE